MLSASFSSCGEEKTARTMFSANFGPNWRSYYHIRKASFCDVYNTNNDQIWMQIC